MTPQIPYRGTCVWCGQEVWARRIVQQVTAWEVERAAGGANAVHGPDKHYNGKIMHTHCHDEALLNERHGIIRGQMTIE